jgi:toxin ParE1/3/4
MRQYGIVWRPKARADLLALYDWIASQADRQVAFEYTRCIEEHVNGLTQFPKRGTPRDDLVAGLRTLVYRRRTVIAYRVLESDVEILRVSHGGRDLGQLFDEV